MDPLEDEHGSPSKEKVASDQGLTVSTIARTNSGDTAAFNTLLEEATKLKERADNFKNSGFELESNETYFKAALKFLHGAYLLENYDSEGSKHGDMSHLQIYASSAKLFKSCANRYERCKELAAAALAYKCMEVAYMRVVYCKHSGINRQSTLQMVIDFTQDANFAMEASSKCQSTFAAANEIMEEEARNRECLTCIRRVIDFSFHNVDELVPLVWIATKSISHLDL